MRRWSSFNWRFFFSSFGESGSLLAYFLRREGELRFWPSPLRLVAVLFVTPPVVVGGGNVAMALTGDCGRAILDGEAGGCLLGDATLREA